MKNGRSPHRPQAADRAWPAHGKDIDDSAAFAVPEIDPEATVLPPENILRWEDDGGTVIYVCDPRLCHEDLLAEGSLRG